MAEVSVLSTTRSSLDERDTIGAEVYPNNGSLKTSAPAPNPNFSFPTLPPAETVLASDLPETQTGGLKIASHRSRPSNISIGPLPPFSFPSPSPGLSPPAGSSGAEPSPTRAMQVRGPGHRRGGSEFIGGDGSAKGPGLMSASPTKGEDVLPSPPTSGRRRGHAHRRSGAVSNHDLSAMLKPSPDSPAFRSGSAPNSPSDPNTHRRCMPSLDHSASQPTLRSQQPTQAKSTEETPGTSPQASPKASPRQSSTRSSPGNGQSRPRVGFSDTLEFIPRPLSTISSETSSSLSTVRASHSVTGSITSVISNNTSSPPSAKKQQHTAETLREYRLDEQRPRTADSPPRVAMLGTPFQPEMPQSERPSSADAGRVLKLGSAMTSEPNPFSASSGPSDSEHPPPPPSPQLNADLRRLRGIPADHAAEQARPRSSPEPKVTKKHKKVKTWAGSLLSRKGKTKSSEALDNQDDRTATLQEFAPMGNFSLDNVDFDEDTTCVIRNPDYEPPRSANAALSASRSQPDAYNTPGVLDLDATWRALDDEDSKASGSKRRTMHSSGVTGGFTGPGMHYHRRAESAPALTPVSESSGIVRRGSHSQMADVFEEEEEEEGASRKSKREGWKHVSRPSEEERELMGLGVSVVDADKVGADNQIPRPTRRRLLEHTNTPEQATLEPSSGLLKLSRSQEFYQAGGFPVEVVDAVEEPRFSVITKSSDESTITPTFPESISNSIRESVPNSHDFAEQRPHHFDTPSTVSSTASPDVHNITFDGPRLHTAASSITDRSTWSSNRAPESAHAVSCSTEDVPSLTSSASTMISGHPPQPSPAFPPFQHPHPPTERSFSFSAAVPRRTRPASAGGKRSSLASLSRLVSTSYGEKSKLSIESFAAESNDKSDKKKRHRISRLMKFWKPKEKLNTANGE